MDLKRDEAEAGAIDSAVFGTWEWDLRQNALRFCNRAKAIVGLAPDSEITLEKLRAATHPDDGGFSRDGLNAALDPTRDGRRRLRWRARRPDGSFQWVLMRVQEELAQEGPEVSRFFGTVQDDDHEGPVASALLAAERRLALALASGRMAIWDYDVRNETLTASPELNELLGFPRDAVVSMEDLRAASLPGERERVSDAAREALERGDRSFEVEYRLRRRDEKTRWMLLRGEFLLGTGQKLERILGVLKDVTHRRAADETNAYLATVVSSSPDAIVTFDHAGGILTWNEAAERIFGYSKAEAIGKPFAMLLARVADYSQSDPLEKVWSGEVLQFEDERRRQDGAVFHAAVTAAPVRAPNGRIVSVVATVRDVTSRKNNERRRALLVRELHHRVRNTLATVQAIAGASARYATSLDEFRETFSQRIGSLAQAHALLTEDNWQSVDLRQLMLLELKPYADLARTTLEGPQTVLDAQTAIPIGMAIYELTTNAARHGALSTRAGHVEISWSVSGAGAAREIELTWRECGGPRVKPPSHRGFGSLLLNTILKMQLGAAVETEYAPKGLQFRMHAALQEPVR